MPRLCALALIAAVLVAGLVPCRAPAPSAAPRAAAGAPAAHAPAAHAPAHAAHPCPQEAPREALAALCPCGCSDAAAPTRVAGTGLAPLLLPTAPEWRAPGEGASLAAQGARLPLAPLRLLDPVPRDPRTLSA